MGAARVGKQPIAAESLKQYFSASGAQAASRKPFSRGDARPVGRGTAAAARTGSGLLSAWQVGSSIPAPLVTTAFSRITVVYFFLFVFFFFLI